MAQNATILEIENVVQTAAGGKSEWAKAAQKQSLAIGDRIRTRQRSRATLALTGLYTVRLDQFTTIEITPVLVGSEKPKLDLQGGAAFIFSREKEGEMDIRMPGANAALRGTQLFARVLPGGKSFIQVLEGSVEMENADGRLLLKPGEAGEAIPGQAPRRTAVIEAENILQWALYYPAVLDPADLGMSGTGSQSLAAYRRGNLLGAVESLPAKPPREANGRLYSAGVLLAVGRMDESRQLLSGVPPDHPGRRALDRMIAAVLLQPRDEWRVDAIKTASEAMAESYYLQSLAKLEPARIAALRATGLAPDNGFAWTRLAELEFSAGHTEAARTAIEKGLAFTPENARAQALRGFILSSENRIDEARAAFENSVRLDGGFGNGWLGLGLTKIKKGDLEAGRADLQTAATVEPTSSVFHSYLAKAMSQDRRDEEAAKELKLARLLDPNDPTPLLYSALIHQEQYKPNLAIGELEESIALNDNRRLYRSALLLDQDRAVRGANLAKIYQTNGMKEVAVREATRAVESDYTNPSAHLFLANSFDALRDPDRIQLRYETPWFNELLLSNLLSPVGGGSLSQFVSQQEYSKLLEADGIGGNFTTDWRSSSEVRSTASVFGTEGKVSYGLDAYYQNDPGDRPDSEMELQEIYGQLKWQPTPDDIFYFLGKWATQDGGDNSRNYENKAYFPDATYEENQQPGLLLGGWNHRWAPGSNTLFLAGKLSFEQSIYNPSSMQFCIDRKKSDAFLAFLANDKQVNANPIYTDPKDKSIHHPPELLRAIQPYLGTGNIINDPDSYEFTLKTRRKYDVYSAEIQQIEQSDHHTLLIGGRWQQGRIETDDYLTKNNRRNEPAGFAFPAADKHVESDFLRTGLYAYDYWSVMPRLTLIGGLAWDTMHHPDNFRNSPINDEDRRDEDLSAKLGFTWEPCPWVTVRGLSAGGMGGLSFDESVRLEPSQLAGFNQAYRSVISESLAGSVESPIYQICGLSVEGSLPTRTWWGVSINMIDQEVERTRGVFTGYSNVPGSITDPAYFADGIAENLDYQEASLGLTLNQLLGEEFSIGAGYRFTGSDLRTRSPDLESQPEADLHDKATLQELSFYADWNSPTGLFAHGEINGFHQNLDEDNDRIPVRHGDEFVQLNLWAGYRFNHNRSEITAGILNIGNRDYHLSPLNPYGEIARERTFFVSCRFSF